MAETVAEILEAYRSGAARPEDIVARSYARIRAHDDPAIFISLRDEAELLAEARALQQAGKTSLPLYGIPVAVKDNIDVKGLPTTAACPAYSYRPNKDAACVAKLREAGALIIGKTNLDQFATGLVGVRTPYGIGAEFVRSEAHPGRLQHRLGVGGRRRARAAFARHGYRRIGPRTGRLRQHRRLEAEPRSRLERGRGAGLPHARLRLGVRPDRR